MMPTRFQRARRRQPRRVDQSFRGGGVRSIRGPLALVLASIGLVVVSPAVIAQESEEAPATGQVTVLGVDTRDPTAAVAYIRTEDEPGEVAVAVNGVDATAESTVALAASGTAQYTALVIDTSEAAGRDELLPQLVSAALDYVQGAPANEVFTLVASGGAARLEAGLTPNRDRIAQELGELVASGRTATFDAMKLAIDQLEDLDSAAIRNVVVFAASADDNSSIAPATVRGDALTEDVNVYVVSVQGVDGGSLERIATSSDGRYVAAVEPTDVDTAVASFRSLVDNTYAVGFTSADAAVGGTLTLTVSGQQVSVLFHESSVTRGSALSVAPPPEGKGFLQDNVGLMIGIGLGFVAAALAAYAVASLMNVEEDALGDILSNYSGAAAGAAGEAGEGAGRGSLRDNALFQRVVSMTNQFAEDKGFLPRVETKLEQSDVPLRAAEALTFYVAAIGGAGVLGLLLGQSMVTAVVGLMFGGLFPPAFLGFKAKRRIKKFVGQLPDTLQLLSSTLKAGYSFMQGVEAVSKEVSDPMGSELRRVVTEAQLGRAVEDALDASAERMGSEDFAWAVMAVRIQREVGGNLAELLLTVAETMTARERLRREVSALTAEGRMSAIVLGALPVGLGFIMYAINPEYTGLLLSNTLGNIMLGVAVVAALIGFVWMKKIIDIKI